jgi:hypothetical protein
MLASSAHLLVHGSHKPLRHLKRILQLQIVFEGPVAATGKKLQPNWTQLEKTGNSVAVAGFS